MATTSASASASADDERRVRDLRRSIILAIKRGETGERLLERLRPPKQDGAKSDPKLTRRRDAARAVGRGDARSSILAGLRPTLAEVEDSQQSGIRDVLLAARGEGGADRTGAGTRLLGAVRKRVARRSRGT